MIKYLFFLAREIFTRIDLNTYFINIYSVRRLKKEHLPYFLLGVTTGGFLSYYGVGVCADLFNIANFPDNLLKFLVAKLLEFYGIKYNLLSVELQIEFFNIIKENGFIKGFPEIKKTAQEYLKMVIISPQVPELTTQLSLSPPESKMLEVSQNLENIGIISSQHQSPVSETLTIPRRRVPNFWTVIVAVGSIIIITI